MTILGGPWLDEADPWWPVTHSEALEAFVKMGPAGVLSPPLRVEAPGTYEVRTRGVDVLRFGRRSFDGKLSRAELADRLGVKVADVLRVPEELLLRCEAPWVGDVRIATAPTSGTVRYVTPTAEVPPALMLLAEGAPLLRGPRRV